MKNTKIEWCDYTLNLWWGCEKVSPGCKFCYAESMDRRWAGSGEKKRWDPHWGPGSSRKLIPGWRDKVRSFQKEAERIGRPVTVFVQSMGDIFEDDRPTGGDPHSTGVVRSLFFEMWYDHPKAFIHCPDVIFLLLTKRPENINDMIPEFLKEEFPRNIWFGCSVVNQEEANEKIPVLMDNAPGWNNKFISVEPMLSTVNLRKYGYCFKCQKTQESVYINGYPHCMECGYTTSDWTLIDMVDWVICGGESGPKARPPHPEWIGHLQEQCLLADIPFFFKQWGTWAPNCECGNKKPHKQIRRPTPGSIGVMFKCGKKNAGRKLYGQEYNEFPKSFQR